MRPALLPSIAWLIAIVLLAPLFLVWLPATSDAVAGDSAAPPLRWSTIAASVAVAAAAATLATAFGACCGVFLSLTRIAGRSFMGAMLLFPFLAPPTAWALMHLYCYGPGGLLDRWLGSGWRGPLRWLGQGGYLGTILVLAQIYAPIALLIVSRGTNRLATAGLEAALLAPSRGTLIRWLVGALRLEWGTAWLLSFALAIGNLSVPQVLQCPLLSTEVYLRSANYLDRHGALMAAIPLAVVALAAALSIAWLDGRRDYAAAQIDTLARWPANRRQIAVAFALIGYLIFTTGLPLAAIIHESQSFAAFLDVVRKAHEQTENTLIIAGCAMLAALAAGMLSGAASARFAGTTKGWLLDGASLTPIVVPGLVVAIAYARFYNRTWPVDLAWIGDGSLLVILALASRGWPFAARLWSAGYRRQMAELRDLSDLDGVSRLEHWRRVSFPLLLDQVAAAGVICFAIAAGDAEISQVLCAAGTGTLALHLLTVLHFDPHTAASLALLQIGLSFVPVALYLLLCNRWPTVA